MKTKVKICGITRRKDAEAAVELGAEFLGFNFYPASPRYIEPALARSILSDLPRGVIAVGVFVNEDPEKVRDVLDTAAIGTAQLHGDEDIEYCRALGLPYIKAFRVSGEKDLEGIQDYEHPVLIDSKTAVYGGSGEPADWGLVKKAASMHSRVILAGGLSPDNAGEAVRAVRPWAVDVASGVESGPGIKEPEKIKRFIEEVKNAAG